MEVITIESRAYKELVDKIDTIARIVAMQQPATEENPDETWVDNYEVCTFLKISERTLQRLRTKGVIAYSIISGKSYYTIAEIKRLLNQKLIKSNDESLQDLINHHRLRAEQKRKSNGNSNHRTNVEAAV